MIRQVKFLAYRNINRLFDCVSSILEGRSLPINLRWLGFRRSTSVETGLFQIQGELMQSRNRGSQMRDPLASADMTRKEYVLALTALDALAPADAVILAVAHRDYLAEGWPLLARLVNGGNGTVLDVKSRLGRGQKPEGVDLWRL
jgi:hypothetical protein